MTVVDNIVGFDTIRNRLPVGLHIAIVTGGDNEERDISCWSARAVASGLKRLGYVVSVYDFPHETTRLVNDAEMIDFVFVMIHGRGGEDGQIVGLLDLLGLPYQCDSRDVLSLTMNKWLTKKVWASRGLPVASDILLDKTMSRAMIKSYLASFDYHCVVKALGTGSSQGLLIVKNVDQGDDVCALIAEYGDCLCETFVSGREVTVSILGETVLPVVEIILPDGKDFDYENKYNGTVQEICPADFDTTMTATIKDVAWKAYTAVGCKRYARVDIIMGSDGPILLEINTIPGFTDESLFPLAAKSVGLDFDELLLRLIDAGLAD